MRLPIVFMLASSMLAVCAVQAAGAHVHGVAKLDIAVEPGTLTLQLEAPLENLLGFERAPRTDAERRQADAMVARFKANDGLFKIDPAAQCTLKTVALSSSALKLGTPGPSEDGHADIDASVEFQCVDASKAAFIDVGLFSFARMQRLDVQVATPKGQFKRELKRPASRIVLTK